MDRPDGPAGADFYLNPVYKHSCPDPFVLKYCGEYWCYSTGFWRDGRCFGVLHSRDLTRWRELGGAMERLAGDATCYWAPEVTYDNGLFYMYYSVGNEKFMDIRVATAEDPAGPFIDSGHKLTSEEFAIDPHVFQDTDGARYMFYATDFLEHTHIGTGTVVDRMVDPFTLAGRPRPVTRARFDWQVYDPRRAEKGGVRWHTVEGPFVLKHKGRYYQMFSGGNWKNMTYGVSFAVADSIETLDEWAQFSDGERVLPILRTLPGEVIGPGHNSVVRGLDNRQLFCIYHRWDVESDARVLALDRQDWAGGRINVLGPTTTPQPAPLRPAACGHTGDEQEGRIGNHWDCAGGRWLARDGGAVQQSAGESAQARCKIIARHFLAEVSLRSLSAHAREGAIGITVTGDKEDAVRFRLSASKKQAIVSRRTDDGWAEDLFDLPQAFKLDAYHLLRVEVDDGLASIALDEASLRWEGRVLAGPKGVALTTDCMAGAFAGFALTLGWQDLFMKDWADPAGTGWQPLTPHGRWYVNDYQLWYSPDCGQPQAEGQYGAVAKGDFLDSYELVVNARLDDEVNGGCYGFYPALDASRAGLLYTVERAAEGWALLRHELYNKVVIPLPHDFDPTDYQQLRFRKQGAGLSIHWGLHLLDEVRVPSEPARPVLYARGSRVAFDMARVTAID